MAKRTATSDLNHDNWDREDEAEEAGTFSRANEDTLKARVIKVAKRRNPISSQSEDGKPSAFGGFAGFAKTQQPAAATGSFNFLTNLKKTEVKTNGTSEKEADDHLDEYYAKLKGLNESVLEWIKKHVSTNPLINLQPVFKDYEKYFNDLEKLKADKAVKHNTSSASTVTVPQFSFGSSSSISAPNFSFGTAKSKEGDSTKSKFSLGNLETNKKLDDIPKSTFSFEKPPDNHDKDSSKPLFSFGNTVTDNGKFSFSSTVVKPADPPPKSEEADEDEEPPNAEFKPVVEEGHIYSTRCKVFVKKDGSFAVHGVGTLFLKPLEKNPKVQLIVRADTTLGPLICNFILSETIPVKRMGKKDVMLVCVPNPEMPPPPVPILLRVKSSEDADELFQTLEKHKK